MEHRNVCRYYSAWIENISSSSSNSNSNGNSNNNSNSYSYSNSNSSSNSNSNSNSRDTSQLSSLSHSPYMSNNNIADLLYLSSR